jgi:purine-binding chemotaxis protein CheW
VIIVEVGVDGENTVLGAMADSVQEVIDLGPDQIEPPPRIGTRLDTQFIQGMGRRDEEFIIILDVDRVFSAGELERVQATSGISAPETAPSEAAAAPPA